MGTKCEISLISMIAKKISFEINEEFQFGANKSVTLKPIFQRYFNKIDSNNFTITLSTKICSTKDNVIPFNLEIIMEAQFNCEDWESEENTSLVKNNTTAIIFPFLRAMIANTTATANVSPYVLPIFNINQLFDEQEVKKDE